MTLTDFLLARIAEDETVIRSGPEYIVRQITGVLSKDPEFPEAEPAGWHWAGQEFGEDLSMDPDRALAECEAKRRIVEWTVRLLDILTDDERRRRYGDKQPLELRALALPYADHPDYRDEWRPEIGA